MWWCNIDRGQLPLFDCLLLLADVSSGQYSNYCIINTTLALKYLGHCYEYHELIPSRCVQFPPSNWSRAHEYSWLYNNIIDWLLIWYCHALEDNIICIDLGIRRKTKYKLSVLVKTNVCVTILTLPIPPCFKVNMFSINDIKKANGSWSLKLLGRKLRMYNILNL